MACDSLLRTGLLQVVNMTDLLKVDGPSKLVIHRLAVSFFTEQVV